MKSAPGDCLDIDRIKLLQTTLNSVITATRDPSSDTACLPPDRAN